MHNIPNEVQTVTHKLLNIIKNPGFCRDIISLKHKEKGFTKKDVEEYQGVPDPIHPINVHWGFLQKEELLFSEAWQLLINEEKIIPVEGDLWKLAKNTDK